MVALDYAVTNLPAPEQGARLSVGVLVDLELSPQAGGHVKCWERLARAARAFPDQLDLTVHFTGPKPAVEVLGPNVRYVIEPCVLSTARFRVLSHVPDHTDLSPYHPRLARALRSYQVIHTTDAFFSYARTAARVARRTGIPLVTSVHTNTPEYSRMYTRLTIERLFGRGVVSRFMLDRLALDRAVERRMLAQLDEHQRRCAFTFVSRPEQLEPAERALGGRAGLLRRGIERELFTPQRRNRAWLAQAYGIPIERTVVLFVGRLNRGKNVLLLADAVAALVADGLDLQVVCAGVGDQREAVLATLGARATCPGSVPPEELARLYASADLFALPSEIEESANVVLEALASGLPVLVTRESGMGRAVVEGETGLTLPGAAREAWATAIGELTRDAGRRLHMARAAQRYAELNLPSWEDVLAEDLLPHWQEAAASRSSGL
ncbi:MAG TPA: glycosyltransferase [Alphaproteobacteria bacterium]|nr:glycosyltransferase [Alphaproteobacteria bacterium]